MKIDIKNIVSITEANQNFSRVARMADERGSILIMKNNAPRYLLGIWQSRRAAPAALRS